MQLSQKIQYPCWGKTFFFLSSVKSDINDPQNKGRAKCNIPPEEVEALGVVMKLQKDRRIMIKPCDKGAGIIILDFEEYIKACNNHLDSEQKMKMEYPKILSRSEQRNNRGGKR